MKRLKEIMMVIMAVFLVVGCSNNDDNTPTVITMESLYAIILPEGEQTPDITPDNYVMTIENIIAVNPETGQFLMKNTERIDSKAFPIPTQYIIQFYSHGLLLFSANLNSVISSYMQPGLTFLHLFTDKEGISQYYLQTQTLMLQDGKMEGDTSEQQDEGMKKMYDILSKAGKISKNIEFDFQFK